MRLAPTLPLLVALLWPTAVAASLQFEAEYCVPAGGAEILIDGYSVPCFADWNADGLPDLVVGEGGGLFAGKVRVYLNGGTSGAPLFADFSYVRTLAGELSYPAG
jgi:hypothetical protein